MSIKTAIKDHFTNNALKEHLGNNTIKDHWGYFVHNHIENVNLENSTLNNKVNIRKFSRDDLDECTRLYTQVFSSYPWYDNWVSSDQVRNYLTELIENPVFEGFVLLEDSKIVAVCMGHKRSWWMGKEFVVDEFLVENGRQGNGIGTKMMNFMSNTLSDHGYTRLILLTDKEIPAESFYLKNGFYNNYKRTVMVKKLN